jgi:hypothetical protein
MLLAAEVELWLGLCRLGLMVGPDCVVFWQLASDDGLAIAQVTN